MRAKIRKTLTRTGETITDLHVWQNDTDHLSAIVADKTTAREASVSKKQRHRNPPETKNPVPKKTQRPSKGIGSEASKTKLHHKRCPFDHEDSLAKQLAEKIDFDVHRKRSSLVTVDGMAISHSGFDEIISARIQLESIAAIKDRFRNGTAGTMDRASSIEHRVAHAWGGVNTAVSSRRRCWGKRACQALR